jgi:hypothetical protein
MRTCGKSKPGVLLRSLSGYIAAPRAVEVANFAARSHHHHADARRRAGGRSRHRRRRSFSEPQFIPAADETDDERPGPNVPAPGRADRCSIALQPQTANPQFHATGHASQFPAGQQAPASQPSPTPVAPYGGVAVPEWWRPRRRDSLWRRDSPLQATSPGRLRRRSAGPAANTRVPR